MSSHSARPGTGEVDPSRRAPERPSGALESGRSTSCAIARKVGAALVSFWMLLVIGFVIFSLMPADPVAALTRGRPTSDAQMAYLRKELGLDQPLWERFLHFVNNTLHGHLGYSWEYQQSVSSLIPGRLWPTMLLMGTSTSSRGLGLWLGIRSGWRPGSLLDARLGHSLTLWSVPTFWLGLILLVLFGSGGWAHPGDLPGRRHAEPGVAGGSRWPRPRRGLAPRAALPDARAVIFAQYVTIMRSSIIDELGSPYLLTARAKGLRDDDVRRRHAVPNALLPSVTVIFLQIGSMIGGAITVEIVYSWPGLGYLTYTALKIPDLPLLQGTFIVFSATVIVFNLIADLLYRVLDPRVRRQ